MRAGRLLLVRRGRPPSAGRWSVPGGRVELGESLAEATVRETAEETGLEASCGELLGCVERVGPGYHFVIADFLVRVGPGEPVAGDDADDAAWVPLTAVRELALVEGLEEFLSEHGILGAARS